jgi:GNAT superfamily N-acetyltransferase
MMNQLRIRRARLDDIPTLQEVIPLAYRVLGAAHISSQQIESGLIYVIGVDTQMIKDGTYYVAEIDRQIVGGGGWCKRRKLFGGDQITAPEDNEWRDPARHAAGIRGFFVHPNWARRGIGRRLLKKCERQARRANFSALELIATPMGEPMYAGFGFEVTERLEFRFPDGVVAPAARMLKPLDCAEGSLVKLAGSRRRRRLVVQWPVPNGVSLELKSKAILSPANSLLT